MSLCLGSSLLRTPHQDFNFVVIKDPFQPKHSGHDNTVMLACEIFEWDSGWAVLGRAIHSGMLLQVNGLFVHGRCKVKEYYVLTAETLADLPEDIRDEVRDKIMVVTEYKNSDTPIHGNELMNNDADGEEQDLLEKTREKMKAKTSKERDPEETLCLTVPTCYPEGRRRIILLKRRQVTLWRTGSYSDMKEIARELAAQRKEFDENGEAVFYVPDDIAKQWKLLLGCITFDDGGSMT